ncbi:N-acetylglucosamine-6-phosphate deacetylase [Alteromonas macleodii]|jgi:N-acetylglucosamine-6-phosphate deacetylase|uniref:N-acetylgalactosamine-6-phosphate deacetylase n=1 Tax=Alteromonas macleodii (strain English Channel 673) TaxID=1004788 RepID=A0AB33A1J5_ALTME|nr:N-acetylglucosamine-6-phosphate deacetylase [Alteromonas macleodii]AFT75517.1 N-acetylglucosamine-6-phosphate deacetylase [Alteromonas macleodii str. 'English Channel 673']MBL3811216.1 N-acetylglucosamine-6-phosphate deacetylase [Alteromonas macleodii]MBL3884754.1 N-acetylglucosamine-6-phosphate deacetylase [Alteromonas macleodii]
MKTIILAEKVLMNGAWQHNQVLSIEKGVIADIAPLSYFKKDATATINERIRGAVIPGYIDTQVNGGGGAMFNHAPTFESINVMAEAHLKYGTTTLFPTLITDDIDTIEQAADAVSEAIAQAHPSVEGVHFEGPHLSVEKKGVHLPRYIRALSDRELATYTRRDIGQVLITVAPENVPCDIIRDLVGQGVIVALGHSNAPFETVQNALDAGASGFTHLYNAMSPLTSREPGMVGAALLNNSVCGIIVDHHHIHPKAVEFAYKVKGPHQLMLVTDAMAHVGASDDTIAFFDTHITRQDNKLTTPDGTLAGSCLDMHGAVTNSINDINIALEHASTMASATPARFTKIHDRVGELEVGKRANFLVINNDNTLLEVWQNGRKRLCAN